PGDAGPGDEQAAGCRPGLRRGQHDLERGSQLVPGDRVRRGRERDRGVGARHAIPSRGIDPVRRPRRGTARDSSGVVGRPVLFSASVFDRWSAATVTWSFGDGGTANGAAVSHAYTRPGTYGVTITAVDGAGNRRTAGATVTIGCAPPPGGTLIDANCNVVRPAVTHVAESHAVWREGSKLATAARAKKRRPPIGTTFTFALNTAASVKLVFAHTVEGRKVA